MSIKSEMNLATFGRLAALLACAAVSLLGQACSSGPAATSPGAVLAGSYPEDGGLAAALDGVDLQIALEIHKHYLALERAANGTTGADFGVACAFFQRLTGSELHVDMQYVGALPTAKTLDDMRQIRAWLKANARYLFWDKTQGTVGVERRGA